MSDISPAAADVIRRIGQPPTPGQATIQLLREEPAVLDYMARALFASETGRSGVEAVAAYDNLSATERESWQQRAFEHSVLASNSYDASRTPEPTDPGDGGQPISVSRDVA